MQIRMDWVCALGIFFGVCVAAPGMAEDAPPAVDAPVLKRTGSFPQFQLTTPMFSKWSKYLYGGSKGTMYKFYKFRDKIWQMSARTDEDPKDVLDYDVGEQSAFVYVPENYKDDTPFGIVVHLSDEESGSLPAGWAEVLAKHKLIYAQPNKSGNMWSDLRRMALALDMIETIAQEYSVDEERFIFSGAGTGGAVAQVAVIAHEEIFTAVISHGYGLLFRNTDFGERRRGRGLRGLVDKFENWDAQTGFVSTSQLKKVVKKDVDVVLYTAPVQPFAVERVLNSADQWAQLGVPLLVIDLAQGGGAVLDGEWLDKAIRFIDGEMVEVPLPRYEAYDLKVDVSKNNKNKKPPVEEKEPAKKEPAAVEPEAEGQAQDKEKE